MKNLLTLFLVFGVLSTLAAPRSIEEIMKTPVKELTPEEHALRSEHIRKVRQRIFGDDIVKPNSQQGKIVFLNAQDKLAHNEIENAVAALYKCVKFKFEVKADKPDGKRPTDRAALACADFDCQVAIVIVADDATPAVLVAPEISVTVTSISGT